MVRDVHRGFCCVRVRVIGLRLLYGALLSTGIYTRGCHWFPRPRLTNDVSLSCSPILLVDAVNCVQTLKVGSLVPDIKKMDSMLNLIGATHDSTATVLPAVHRERNFPPLVCRFPQNPPVPVHYVIGSCPLPLDNPQGDREVITIVRLLLKSFSRGLKAAVKQAVQHNPDQCASIPCPPALAQAGVMSTTLPPDTGGDAHVPAVPTASAACSTAVARRAGAVLTKVDNGNGVAESSMLPDGCILRLDADDAVYEEYMASAAITLSALHPRIVAGLLNFHIRT
jgi:hypothetical protein